VGSLPQRADPNILVGFASGDDSGVYRLSDEVAIAQSVDILTPVVDDPRVFGQIAAANALSDLYAMGAEPLTALNILAIPPGLAPEIPKAIQAGGFEKLAEAEAAVIGGHTIDDPELKYGVCVTGTVHPKQIIRNSGARPGDTLILTKAIGTGVVSTAIKAGMCSEEHAAAAARSMATLNKAAAEAMLAVGASACTDVTGFGLVGHLLEMVEASGVSAEVEAAKVPLLPGALDYCGMGLLPAGSLRLKKAYAERVEIGEGVGEVLTDLLFDAQTSGGLLIATPRPEELLAALAGRGVESAAAIGVVVAEPRGRVKMN